MLVKDLTTDQLKILIQETIKETPLELVRKQVSLTPDEILNLAKEVYNGLSTEDIAEIESITLSRFTI
jgi:hypothetical protein